MARVLDFKDHRRELDRNRYVYAVVSRRSRGLSIGVNLNPDKVCNFDCPYCQVDRSIPGASPAIDVPLLAAELDALLVNAAGADFWDRAPFDTVPPALRRVADIAFSGDGEPTTPAAFPEAAAAVREVRDRSGLRIPMRLITNATMFDRPRVRAALAHFDELWCKLDAGSSEYFSLVDGTSFPFERVLANLLSVARERAIVIQSLFLSFAGQGPGAAELDAYAERLAHIVAQGGHVDRVQVYTVARRPADPRVASLPVLALDEIAARVRRLGLTAEVHGSE